MRRAFGIGWFIVAAMRVALHICIDGRARIAVVARIVSRYTCARPVNSR